MTALLRAEMLKLRTTRTFVALAGVTLGTSLLLAGLVCLLSEPTEESVLTDVFTSDTSSLFILLLGIVGIAGEWRHRTIASSLLAAPDRRRFLAAKTVAYAAAGLTLSLFVSMSVAVLGFALLSARDLPLPEAGELVAQWGHNALVAALLGALGVALGAVVRNQVVAIVGVLVLSFVAEPLVIDLVPAVGRFGPFVALPVAVQDIPASSVGLEGVDLVAPGLALLAMLAWIGAVFGAGAALLRRRDLT
jgi:ABC-2 type transport system permease protein